MPPTPSEELPRLRAWRDPRGGSPSCAAGLLLFLSRSVTNASHCSSVRSRGHHGANDVRAYMSEKALMRPCALVSAPDDLCVCCSGYGGDGAWGLCARPWRAFPLVGRLLARTICCGCVETFEQAWVHSGVQAETNDTLQTWGLAIWRLRGAWAISNAESVTIEWRMPVALTKATALRRITARWLGW